MASKFLSYGGTYAGVLIIVILLGKLFSRWAKEAGVEFIDKGLGGAFGFARGFLIMFLIYLPFNYLIEDNNFPKWAKDSYSVVSFHKTFQWWKKEIKLDEKIEERGEGGMIKFSKIDPKDLGVEEGSSTFTESITEATKKLRDAMSKELKNEEVREFIA